MPITIYNILCIIFSFILISNVSTTYVFIFYILLSIIAMGITFLSQYVCKDYPNMPNKQKQAMEQIFYNQIGIRVPNYIGSYIVHMILIYNFIFNIPLMILLTTTFFFRMYYMFYNNNKIQKEKEK